MCNGLECVSDSRFPDYQSFLYIFFFVVDATASHRIRDITTNMKFTRSDAVSLLPYCKEK